jgi:hypothetical protein
MSRLRRLVISDRVLIITRPLLRHRRILEESGFLLGAAIFLSLLFFTPAGVSIFRLGDMDIYLLDATRMLEGQLIYRDFFQFTPPGIELVYLALFKLFTPRVWIPNLMLVVLGLGLTWLSVAIARRVMVGPVVFLPGLLFLTFSFSTVLDASHHWFSILAVMAATAVIIEKRTPRRMAGALCGLASFFTQTRGPLAVAAFAIS